MRTRIPLILSVLLAVTSARAEAPTVIACDTLVSLRVLMAAGGHDAMEGALPQHPGCRTISRDRIGAPEHRAMVGGAPFECLAVVGEKACAWVVP